MPDVLTINESSTILTVGDPGTVLTVTVEAVRLLTASEQGPPGPSAPALAEIDGGDELILAVDGGDADGTEQQGSFLTGGLIPGTQTDGVTGGAA